MPGYPRRGRLGVSFSLSLLFHFSSISYLSPFYLGPIIRRALAREISIKTVAHVKCSYKGLLYEFARDLSGRSADNMHLLRPSNELRAVVRSNSYSGVTFLSNIRLNSLTFYRPSLDFRPRPNRRPHEPDITVTVSATVTISRVEFQGIYKNAATRRASARSCTSL